MDKLNFLPLLKKYDRFYLCVHDKEGPVLDFRCKNF